jgi:hypothetical protein
LGEGYAPEIGERHARDAINVDCIRVRDCPWRIPRPWRGDAVRRGTVRLSSDFSEIKIRLKFAPDAPAPNFEPDWNKPPTAPMLVAIRSVDGKRVPKTRASSRRHAPPAEPRPVPLRGVM